MTSSLFRKLERGAGAKGDGPIWPISFWTSAFVFGQLSGLCISPLRISGSDIGLSFGVPKELDVELVEGDDEDVDPDVWATGLIDVGFIRALKSAGGWGAKYPPPPNKSSNDPCSFRAGEADDHVGRPKLNRSLCD
jgi:hypothetical protein